MFQTCCSGQIYSVLWAFHVGGYEIPWTFSSRFTHYQLVGQCVCACVRVVQIRGYSVLLLFTVHVTRFVKQTRGSGASLAVVSLSGHRIEVGEGLECAASGGPCCHSVHA